VRTSTQNNTLGPRWSEHFELNVYRPESRLLRLFRLGDDRDDRAPVVAFLGGLKLEEWYIIHDCVYIYICKIYYLSYMYIYMHIYICICYHIRVDFIMLMCRVLTLAKSAYNSYIQLD